MEARENAVFPRSLQPSKTRRRPWRWGASGGRQESGWPAPVARGPDLVEEKL